MGIIDCISDVCSSDHDRLCIAGNCEHAFGRTAAEGVLAIAGNDQSVAIVELNSETDFVAKGDDFRALARKAAEVAHAHKPADAAALSQLTADAVTLDRSEEHPSELQSLMRI